MKTTSYDLNRLKIDSVNFTEQSIHIKLMSGCDLFCPLTQGRFAAIRNLNAQERNDWKITGDGFGIFWPAIKRPIELDQREMINILDLVWEKITEQALGELEKYQWNLNRLSSLEQDIVVLWRLEADLYNGGFMQFLCNWGDEICQKSLVVLQTIHALASYKIISDINSLLDKFKHHSEVKQLVDIYGLLSQEEQAQLETLEEAYWQDPDGLVKKAVEYFGEYVDDPIDGLCSWGR